MSKFPEYNHKGTKIQGISIGGIQTCIHLPQFKLLFDIGTGYDHIIEVPKLLISHGHLDHSSGIAYYISQRNLKRLMPAEIYVPPLFYEPLKEVLNLWSKIEGYNTVYNLTPLDYNKFYHLQGNNYFKAVKSVHRVPSNGYTIFEKTRKLKEEFQKLPSNKIAELKSKGIDMFYEYYIPLITFSGDTQIEFVINNECVRKSRILFLECTYIDKVRTIEQTREWGHIHLDEIVENVECFREVDKLYLIHFSPRYNSEKILKNLKDKLPIWLFEKTTPFISKVINNK